MKPCTDRKRIATVMLLVVFCGCGQQSGVVSPEAEITQTAQAAEPADQQAEGKTAELVLAGGCFWCMEAAFEQLKGVREVVSGYAGGTAETASYATVSSGGTNHAEAIRILYDPEEISLETLLKVFFNAAHDPTQINRQYPDVGRQYRSAVFYADQSQKQTAAAMIDDLNKSGDFDKPIATTIEPLDEFYAAEDYHQDYVKHHPDDRYVLAYSLPRAAEVREKFPDLIREE